MKLKDLVVGQDYTLKRSKYGTPHHCLLLDPLPGYENANASSWRVPLYHLDENKVRDVYAGGRGSGRVLVAVEAGPFGDEDPGAWYPYAARPQELGEPWADHAERMARMRAESEARAREYAAAEKERRARHQRETEERLRAEEARRLEVDAQRALNLATFDAEVAPVLDQLGTRYSIDRWHGRGTKVTVDLETLRHLVRALEEVTTPHRWPDGEPVHSLLIYVRLSCGHERVAQGWRGGVGARYCCDVCHELATIEVSEPTDQPPTPWRPAGSPR
jgi:hypothetical protein